MVDLILHCDFHGFCAHYLVCGDNDNIDIEQSITLHCHYNYGENIEKDMNSASRQVEVIFDNRVGLFFILNATILIQDSHLLFVS